MSGIIVQTTSVATANALVLRDANGRAKVADPDADTDIDTKGARNTAITAGVATAGYFPIVFTVASPTTAGNYMPMHGDGAGAGMSASFYGMPVPAAMTVEVISSTLRTAGTTASSGAYVATLFTGSRDVIDVVDGHDAPALDHRHALRRYGGFASLRSGLDPRDQNNRNGLDYRKRHGHDDHALVPEGVIR